MGVSNYLESLKCKTNLATFGESQSKQKGGPFRPFRREEAAKGMKRGVQLENFPPGMSSAPFIYKDATTGKAHRMAFMGGITSLVQHEDGAIEPRVGWAVLDSGRRAS